MLDQSRQQPVPGTSTQQEAWEGLIDVGMNIIYDQTVSKGGLQKATFVQPRSSLREEEVMSWNGLSSTPVCAVFRVISLV